MKKIVFIACCLSFIRVFPQSLQNDDSRYCAKLKDGIIVMTKDDEIITDEVLLRDSSRLTKQAILIKKDGKRLALREDECVDAYGNLLAARIEKNAGKKKKVRS